MNPMTEYFELEKQNYINSMNEKIKSFSSADTLWDKFNEYCKEANLTPIWNENTEVYHGGYIKFYLNDLPDNYVKRKRPAPYLKFNMPYSVKYTYNNMSITDISLNDISANQQYYEFNRLKKILHNSPISITNMKPAPTARLKCVLDCIHYALMTYVEYDLSTEKSDEWSNSYMPKIEKYVKIKKMCRERKVADE